MGVVFPSGQGDSNCGNELPHMVTQLIDLITPCGCSSWLSLCCNCGNWSCDGFHSRATAQMQKWNLTCAFVIEFQFLTSTFRFVGPKLLVTAVRRSRQVKELTE